MSKTDPMLQIDDIHYAVDGKPLFTGASANIPDGHKVGLVGRNGTGKTTLFQLIRGELNLDSGTINLRQNTRVGGIEQEAPDGSASILDTVLAADTERANLLNEQTDDHTRIADIQTRLTDIDAWSAEARASAILTGLGFSHNDHGTPCSEFSGGWRMRVALAATLFSKPDLLLLDEPTNHLDLEGALWLASHLASYPYTTVIISHDRSLLNQAADSILHLDRRLLTYYRGNYDQFVRQRRERSAFSAAVAKRQEARRAHLQSYVDRFRYKADKAKQAQSRLKMIARMEFAALPEEVRQQAFGFRKPEKLSSPLIVAEGVSTGYHGTPVLHRLDFRIDQDDRIALLGKNGEGKSTLFKLLANWLDPISGRITRTKRLRIGYFAQHQIDKLESDETPLEHLMRKMPDIATSVHRSKLAGFGLSADQADTPVLRLSGGQKSRLALLLTTLEAPQLLILDEPTNHLDVESREALVDALTSYSGAVMIISHDFHLLGMVADRLWLVRDGTVVPYEGDLDSYRKEQLMTDGPQAPAKSGRTERGTRTHLQSLRTELRKCESRIAKLTEMRERLDEKLADPELYEPNAAEDLKVWQSKYAEVLDGMKRAEALWLTAQEKLDAAESTAEKQ